MKAFSFVGLGLLMASPLLAFPSNPETGTEHSQFFLMRILFTK